MLFGNLMPLDMRLRMQPRSVTVTWQNGRYFCKTHLATLDWKHMWL